MIKKLSKLIQIVIQNYMKGCKKRKVMKFNLLKMMKTKKKQKKVKIILIKQQKMLNGKILNKN